MLTERETERERERQSRSKPCPRVRNGSNTKMLPEALKSKACLMMPTLDGMGG